MSVQSQIDRIEQNVANTYNVLEEAGAEMPQSRNSANLPGTAASISAVLYGKAQTLSEAQKAQARANIGVREPLEPLMGSTDEITPSQAVIALINGRDVRIEYISDDFGTMGFMNFIVAMNGAIIAASCALDMGDGSVHNVSLVGYTDDNIWECTVSQLNAGPLIGLADEITPLQVGAAIAEGRSVFIEYRSDDFGGLGFTNFCIAGSGSVVAASCAIAMGDGSILNASLVGYTAGDDWECTISPLSAQESLIGSADDITPAQVSEALLEGQDVVLAYTDSTYGTIYFSAFLKAAAMDTVACSGVQDVFMNDMHMVMRFSLIGFIDSGQWEFYVSPLAEYSDVAGKLDAAALPEAINTALAQAKASGDFQGDPGPITPAARYAIGDAVENEESVCVIEETGASVSASDNSAYFDKEYIVVNEDTYRLGKEAMLALQHKKLTGNGSVAWNGWDTQPQGWKDAETNHNGSAPLTTAKLKVRYADDPLYLSMKLPGEANISTDDLVRPGMRESNGTGTYVTINNIGATYAVDYTALPDDVVICVGHLSVYTLSREKNAKWKLHDKQLVPTGQAMYYLPWSDARENIGASKITVLDDHVRFSLKKSDFAPSSSVSGSVAKCLHFWGAHNPLDLADNLAVICLYETWLETPGAVGNVYTAIGCDQKSADKTQITQNFWGRNVLLSTEPTIIMGHNISDAVYDELRDTPNDPRLVFADYGTSFTSNYDSKNEVAQHNADPDAHPDIREEIDIYLGDMQSRINSISEVVQPMEVLVPGINLNEGKYEAGYFSESGAEYVGSYGKQSFRTVNYIPVKGGRKIAIYYDKAEWNGNNNGKALYVIQYDANKNVIGTRNQVSSYTSTQAGWQLDSNTAFIRVAFHKWSDITTALTDIKMAVYYLEDAQKAFVEYGFGSEAIYGVPSDMVCLTSPNGTKYALTVSDSGVLSVKAFGS